MAGAPPADGPGPLALGSVAGGVTRRRLGVSWCRPARDPGSPNMHCGSGFARGNEILSWARQLKSRLLDIGQNLS